MMSAAMSMLAGVEQVGKSVGSADLVVDQDKSEGITFAKSFSDGVGNTNLLQAKSSAKEAPIGLLPGAKGVPITKKLDAVVAMPGDGKIKNVTGIPDVAAPTPAAMTKLGAKATANDSAAKNVGPVVEEGETANDASSDAAISRAVPVVLQPSDDVVAPAGPTEENRAFVSSTNSAFVQKETKNVGKTKEISSVRKTAKIAEDTPISKTVQKSAGINGNVISKPAEAGSREDAGAVSQGIVTGVIASPKDDVRTRDNPLSGASAGKTVVLSGVPSAIADVVVRKDTVHETEADAVDTGTTMSSAAGQPALPKFEGELEKAAVTNSGGDSKMQSAPGAGMMAVHQATESMASGVAPLAVVFGNTSGETASGKPQVGDAGGHVTGPTVETREQGMLGVIAAPTETIPTTLKATPTALEVGIQDGTHGWLQIRAEMADGGGVNASVSAASSTGQEMLHRELPAITAYLKQENVAVNAIAFHTPLAAGVEQRSSAGMDGAGGHTPQGSHDGGEPQQHIRKEIPAGSDKALTYPSLHGVDEDGSLSLAIYSNGGSWLSVRA